MSWKTYRVFNNINYINKLNKVIFVQLDDTTYDYDDTVTLSFMKFKQEGILDVNDGVIKVSSSTKIMIEINIMYRYANTTFAPRYTLNIYKNDVKLNSHYCGMNDVAEGMNNIYIVSVVDVNNDDVITMKMIKDDIEDSTSHIEILKNSYINFKTF